MKKTILFSLALLVTASVSIYSCKKGPEDPFLSFKSRKARVSGTWTVSEFTVNGVDFLNHVETDDGSAVCGQFTATTTTTQEISFEFKKNGSYTLSTKDVVTLNTHWLAPPQGQSCSDATETLSDTIYVTKGLWQFAGGIGAYKNKEQLILTDGEDHVIADTYDIIKCTDKEMKLTQSVTNPDKTVTLYAWTLKASSKK